MASKTSINHDGLLALEQSFIKVPYEQMKKTTRTCQKYIEKEMGNVTNSVSELDVVKFHRAKAPFFFMAYMLLYLIFFCLGSFLFECSPYVYAYTPYTNYLSLL